MVVYGYADVCEQRPARPAGGATWSGLTYATDGSDATFSRTTWEPGAGLIVDLGREVDVGRLAIRWASTSATRHGAFLLQGSRDGVSFANLRDAVGLAAHAAQDPQEDTVTFSPARLRYLRVLMQGPPAGDELLLYALRLHEALYAGAATIRVSPPAAKPGQDLAVLGTIKDRIGDALVGETIEVRLQTLDGAQVASANATTEAGGSYHALFPAVALDAGEYLAILACPIPDVLLTPGEGVLTDEGVGLTATDLTFFEDMPAADGYALATETLTRPPEEIGRAKGALVGEETLVGRLVEAFAILQGGDGTLPAGNPMAEGETLPIAQAPDLSLEEEAVITGGFIGG